MTKPICRHIPEIMTIRSAWIHLRPATVFALVAAAVGGAAVGRFTAPNRSGGRTNTSVAPNARPLPAAELSVPPSAPAAAAVLSPAPNQFLPESVSGWEELWRRPPSAARETAIAEWLTRHASAAPEQAMALALAEPHAGRRQRWRAAVLRGWATAAPEDAVAWVLRQPADKNAAPDIAAILAGVAPNPATAFAVVRQLAEARPAHVAEQGSALITALAEAGHFSSAASFALTGPAAQREAWTTAAFARWSEQQPQAATNAAIALVDPTLRDLAWRASIANWAQSEPPSLADYALRLPSGEARTYALGEALRLWIESDPARAAHWIDQLDPGRETDLAVSLVATNPALARRRPDVALSWAESIAEPTARSRAVARVVRVWADEDPSAANGYARTASALLPEDREDLLPGERFAPHP